MKILGVRVDNVTISEAVEKIGELVVDSGKHYVVTPNSEFIVDAQKDIKFKDILNNADLSIPDGMGVVIASRFYGTGLKQRVAGTDLVDKLCREAARKGWTVFFLGGLQGVGERSGKVLQKKYPQLKIAGTYEGKREKKYDQETVQGIKNILEGRRVDILFVAYGHGYQEKWIERNLERLPVSVAVGVGGAFDFISKYIPRAPVWMQRIGLEWLFRLVQQPWRWRRIFKAVVVFPWLVFKDKLI
ncbi:MAG: WecB/TagA/CpsF family glycosyltransferase [Patescibacteria group bacterium]|nr:WecB/TagA/CpsF family glycosyltransferase [Patescibacteria group bacterium]